MKVYVQENYPKTNANQLKLSELQSSINLESLKEKYYILTQEFEKSTYINEAEGIMGELEEILTTLETQLMEIFTKTKPNLKLSFTKKYKVCITICIYCIANF